ncbi:MAG: hypothetical protein ABL907_26030 [Hyphomicrobium sp.]
MTPSKMLSVSVAALGLATLASAWGAAPAAASDDEGSTVRVERNWKGSAKSARRQDETRSTSQRSRDSNGETAARRASRDIDNNDDDDNNGDRNGRGRGRGHGDQGGFDAGEAARIRQAHRESDGHVTLRRDYDGNDYDVPSYRSNHDQRRHWWSRWW